MIQGDDTKAQRLMEVISRFKKAEWHKTVMEGYKPSEMRLLYFIQKGCRQDERGVTISTLSNMMGVSSPTVTPLVRSLEDSGLVVRYNDQEDRRVVRVTLTEKGEAVRKEVKAANIRYFTELTDYLGEERSVQLAELLELVFHYLEKKHKPTG